LPSLPLGLNDARFAPAFLSPAFCCCHPGRFMVAYCRCRMPHERRQAAAPLEVERDRTRGKSAKAEKRCFLTKRTQLSRANKRFNIFEVLKTNWFLMQTNPNRTQERGQKPTFRAASKSNSWPGGCCPLVAYAKLWSVARLGELPHCSRAACWPYRAFRAKSPRASSR